MRKFFVAEIGVNHLGKLNNALELVKSAVRSGSDFLKFQILYSWRQIW